MIKVQIRKLENELVHENQKLHDRITREIKSTIEKSVQELRGVEMDIKQSIRSFQRQRARDKSDYDVAFSKQIDDIRRHEEKLAVNDINFEAIAIVNSMLIENINMQMESEVADLLDRRMMSLFGMSSHKNPNKVDVQNTSVKL